MKKAWVNKKEKERLQRINEIVNQFESGLVELGEYTKDEIASFMDQFERCRELRLLHPTYIIPHEDKRLFLKIFSNKDLHDKTMSFLERMPLEELASLDYRSYSYYLDSEPKHFCGDIIITDPCYLIKDQDAEKVWDNGLDSVIPGSIERSTIYGDWSCTTFDAATKKPIGEFCADGGMVCVCDFSEVMKYNPDYNEFVTSPHTATIIKHFDGVVWFEIKHDAKYDDYSVHVRGKGTNIKTGEPIEFITKQTGL